MDSPRLRLRRELVAKTANGVLAALVVTWYDDVNRTGNWRRLAPIPTISSVDWGGPP